MEPGEPRVGVTCERGAQRELPRAHQHQVLPARNGAFQQGYAAVGADLLHPARVRAACVQKGVLRGTAEVRALLPERPAEIMEMRCDNTKAKTLLGWKPAHTMAEGLAETIEWYRAELAGPRSPFNP